jgi:hypothetical protein
MGPGRRIAPPPHHFGVLKWKSKSLFRTSLLFFLSCVYSPKTYFALSLFVSPGDNGMDSSRSCRIGRSSWRKSTMTASSSPISVAEALLTLATQIRVPSKELVYVADETQAARAKLALDLEKKPQVAFKAIVEDWDLPRITSALY